MILDNKSRDFFFLKRQEPNVIISVMLTLIQKKLPKYVNAGIYDIQVMTPMRKGLLGGRKIKPDPAAVSKSAVAGEKRKRICKTVCSGKGTR